MHLALAKSYLVYFIFILLGLFANTIFTLSVPTPHGQWIALACFAFGPLLIWWAQRTSIIESPVPYFNRGPYRFLRNPTQVGILILIGGYAAVSGSVIFLGAAIIGYFISNAFFFKKYEAILRAEYGDQYENYKSAVPKVL